MACFFRLLCFCCLFVCCFTISIDNMCFQHLRLVDDKRLCVDPEHPRIHYQIQQHSEEAQFQCGQQSNKQGTRPDIKSKNTTQGQERGVQRPWQLRKISINRRDKSIKTKWGRRMQTWQRGTSKKQRNEWTNRIEVWRNTTRKNTEEDASGSGDDQT